MSRDYVVSLVITALLLVAFVSYKVGQSNGFGQSMEVRP